MGVFIVYQLSILSFSCSSTARSTAHMGVYVRCMLSMFQRDAILRLWFVGAISSPNVNGTNVPCIYHIYLIRSQGVYLLKLIYRPGF